ncbi:MAG: hypothetical protein DME50_10950 [Verrucomicrobia bacterium]|nr:MAG: hypothetical protein DME50_10950 [Verrucomicrobiota bacterium]
MMIFHIEYLSNGATEPCQMTLRGASAGVAQAKFHAKKPGARILRCWTEARAGGCHLGFVNYAIASTARVEPLPAAADATEQTFGFFSECVGKRPNERRTR